MKTLLHNTHQAPMTSSSLNKEFAQLQPDALLACQVRPRMNTLQKSEWLLLWALLADALHVLTVFRPGRPGRSSKERKQWEADLAWVRGEEEGPFSFAFVCDHLGLDRDAVRSHVERMIAESNHSG